MKISKIKSFVIGMVFFMGAMMFGGGKISAQEVFPEEGEQGVCCKRNYAVFCTDRSGDAAHNYKRINDVTTCTGNQTD